MPALAGRNFTNGDAAVGGGLLAALIAVFLPWYSASSNGIAGAYQFSYSMNAFGHWTGVIFFLALLVGLGLFVVRNFVPNVKLPDLPQPDAMLYLGLGVLMAVMAILFLLIGSGASASSAEFSAGPSLGLYLGLIAAVAVAAGGFLKRGDPQPTSPPFNAPSGGPTYGGGTPPPAPPAS